MSITQFFDKTSEAIPTSVEIIGIFIEEASKIACGPPSTLEVTKYKSKIFKPGYSTKRRGWGLGLSLSKRIIKDMHHGKIKLHNSNSKGTTFLITFKSFCS